MPGKAEPSTIGTLNTEKQEDGLEQMLALDVPMPTDYTNHRTASRVIFEPDNDLGVLDDHCSRPPLMSQAYLVSCNLHTLLVPILMFRDPFVASMLVTNTPFFTWYFLPFKN